MTVHGVQTHITNSDKNEREREKEKERERERERERGGEKVRGGERIDGRLELYSQKIFHAHSGVTSLNRPIVSAPLPALSVMQRIV